MAGATRSVDGTSPRYRLDPSIQPDLSLARRFSPRRRTAPTRTASTSQAPGRSQPTCSPVPEHPGRSGGSACPQRSKQHMQRGDHPVASSPTFPPIEDDPSSPAHRAGSLSPARSRFLPRQVSLTTGYIRPTPHVPPRRKEKTRAQGDLNAGGSATSSRRRSASSWSMTSGCGTTSAGRCSAAEGTSGRHASGLGRGVSSARGPHFQPGTRPACSIHSCISGPCASSRVFTLT